jgi:hypothetical protein
MKDETYIIRDNSEKKFIDSYELNLETSVLTSKVERRTNREIMNKYRLGTCWMGGDMLTS